ncbi:DNA repair protein RecO [Marinilactibacillus psychrotolerans]|uniref:DNA repair protein RecO n=2 Tax=Marinilactibacillus psychrotolerans TaxID=191770 RepID=A0A511GYM8_9LACT|nr:DNA repair protein RecO [Marinilactibacillus psychrotolerans]TLQ08657.1 DNA repair protein RecO [Marinilactibacillus psychrotolerans]SDC24280.1 DNA replication and repair protein RecO [Marinilactibacillus psychrotolerans]SJN42155.1 DNA recombination and repair protein RecO [Marinilactibacillus psychrotolerans 42ea]GEL66274.1 DNA repair protein RecO [Marinilactibacillus psychrotolerans]GEQ32586.1 DNA repair protein RecO [Marinilactibacillus psychrotolerans]
MAHLEEVEGIVISVRKHRERDFLVKLFTDRYGKMMFFVRGTKNPNNKLNRAIQPFSHGTYIADIRDQGLSFLRDAKDIAPYSQVQLDIFKNAYATYACGLADAALEDRIPDFNLFIQLKEGLNLMDELDDPEIILNILEIRFLRYFGVMPELRGCVICGKTEGAFDYSSKFHGLLCPKHYFEDERRYHASPKAIHFIRLFSVISFDKIGSISMSDQTKKDIRYVIDMLYEELVGLKLKSKRFIDHMHEWDGILKRPEE